MEKSLLNIKLRTIPNGYILDVEKKSYMYYNLSELLDGFIYHIGLEELDEVEKAKLFAEYYGRTECTTD